MLQASDSFAPNPVSVLAKRQGQTLHARVSANTTLLCAPLLVRTYDDSGNSYLVVVARTTTPFTTDTIYTSLNDAAFLTPTNGVFTTNSPLYGAAQLGNIVYLGNGADVLKAVNLGSPVTVTNDPFSIGAPAGGGTAATSAADSTASEMFPGTYSFAWATFNSVTKKWAQRFATQTFPQNPGAVDKSIDFTSPLVATYDLAVHANELFHL